ncbi:MAG: hypothetical protein IMY75_00960 [Chloroflexi bacterium]|nr:hypothetical protein [Chloroflexota bacterium]
MERTVPTTGSEEIALYMRTYYSLLRTTDEVQIRSLVETHSGMDSSLHVAARAEEPDAAALIYCSLRLPHCIRQTRLVVMGQSERVFARRGYPNVEQWQPVTASGRRRRTVFDGHETMAAFIASVSDIDDLIPMLTAFQIEWNKMHQRLHTSPLLEQIAACVERGEPDWDTLRDELPAALALSPDDLERFEAIWGDEFPAFILDVGRARKRLAVRLLAGSLVDYRKATQRWWGFINDASPVDLSERPVYFISSNVHSVVNVLSGFALRREDELLRFLEARGKGDLLAEHAHIRTGDVPSRRENLLYFVLREYMDVHRGGDVWDEREAEEALCGIKHIDSRYVFDVEAQVIELRRLLPAWFDPRLKIPTLDRLSQSDAVIVNIDYPLGMGAYHILSQVAASVDSLRGVYILGKAATLNGRIGDVMIPYVVHDEHSRNTYLFNNCFTASDVAPYLIYGTTLDNQKAISVRGTFLQNWRYMDVFYSEGYTDIEMEAGPCLSAIYEAVRPRRHPVNELITLYADAMPFDIGIIHYASDTPLSKGKNLGAQRLSYFGVDATYAATIAILRRILALESARVDGRR